MPGRVAGATIRDIESGVGRVELGKLKTLARALEMTLPALLVPPGRTAEERVVLALWRGRYSRVPP